MLLTTSIRYTARSQIDIDGEGYGGYNLRSLVVKSRSDFVDQVPKRDLSSQPQRAEERCWECECAGWDPRVTDWAGLLFFGIQDYTYVTEVSTCEG